MASIQGIYVALFGRPADPLGLAFWNEETGNGSDLSPLIGTLTKEVEYLGRFDGMSNAEIINSIYQSLFGRDAEPAGLAFFLEELTSGRQTIETIAINILDGAQGDDLATLNAKIAAADLFTTGLDTDAEIDAYAGTDAAQVGIDFLKGIDKDTPADTPLSDEWILKLFPDEGQAPGGGGGGGGGGGTVTPPAPQTLDLTTGTDKYTGGGAGDTFNAAAGTLQSIDVLDGGAGADVLNIEAKGFVENAAPSIKNIETINNATFKGATATTTANLDLAHVSGVREIWTDVSGVTPTGPGAAFFKMNYNNAGLDNVYGVSGWKNKTGENEIDVSIHTTAAATAGANDTLKVALTDTEAGDFIHVVARNGGVEHITVDIANGSATLGLGGAAPAVQSITVTGAGDLTISPKTGSASNSFSLFDASKATGNITWKPENGVLKNDIAIKGGSGNDIFVTGTKNDTITSGSGDDIINASAAKSLNSGDTIDGGEGKDTLNIGLGARADDLENLQSNTDGVRPTLTSIEIINNYDKFGVLDLGNTTGLEEVWTHFERPNASHYYINADENVLFGMTGDGDGKTEHTLSLRFEDHENIDTLNFALKDAAGYKVFSPGEGTKANTVNLSLDNTVATSVSIRRLEVDDIVITGKGDLNYLYSSNSKFNEFDATGLNGNVKFDFSAHTTNATVSTGAGNDIIVGGKGNDIINGGAGDDIIWGDNPGNTASDPNLYGDDTINGGAGNNVIVLGTKAQDIKLGGQDTIIHNAADGGKDLVFNFNFGPVDRIDDINGVAEGGSDQVFDILKASGTVSEIWLGNDNSVYQGVGSLSGNIIKLAGNDIYTGGQNDFELVIKFASGSQIVLANSFSRYEKAKLLKEAGVAEWQSWTDATPPDATAVNDALKALYSGQDFTAGLVKLDAEHVADLIGHLKLQGNLELIA